jgi:hypothetical protein
MSEEKRTVLVPAFYRKLQEPAIVYEWDGSREAWLWKTLRDDRDEAVMSAAAGIIEVYSWLGSYSPTGEDFYLIAQLMSDAGWGDEDELEEFLAANRPEIEREVREIHALRMKDEQQD